jgi:hypothetical protein
MKQTQLAGALVALAVLVFVVTFTMNYIGSSRSQRDRTLPPPARTLTFPDKVAGSGVAPLECENKAQGHSDFWFVNDNEEPVQIGLQKKNCTCADVQLFLPPPEYQARARAMQANMVGQFAGPLGALAGMAATADLQAIQKATSPLEMFASRESHTVPPGAVGWVRMIWNGDRVGPQRLQAVVWTDRPEQETQLEVFLYFHVPVRLHSELILGRTGDGSPPEVRVEDLPRHETIKVWSSTRPELHLEARVVSPHLKPASDPISVGKPEKMTPEEVQQLEKENNSPKGDASLGGRVLCGYRIPVTLARVSANGSTPCDFGPFKRSIIITARDINIDPIQVLFAGRVRSPVRMAVEDESGRIDLGSFPSRQGKSVSVNLTVESADITLEFNRDRTPKFLQGEVKPVPDSGGKPSGFWKLTVTVKPGEVSGTFPEPSNRYQDSAVYLNVIRPNQPKQAVRIPVAGTALDR